MRTFIRSIGVAVLVTASATLVAFAPTVTSAVTLAAQTYIVKGTQFAFPLCLPACGTLSTDQQNTDLATPYVLSTVGAAPSPTVLNYPASFAPVSVGYIFTPRYDDAVTLGVAALPRPNEIEPGSTIFGYSQGAIVATEYKREFNDYYSDPQNGTPPPINFVLIGNGARPNGGAMERFVGLSIPILGFTFSGATPTETAGADPGQITTYDIARQYDGFADFPTNPLNLLATANAVAGVALLHPGYGDVDMSQAVFQGTMGDTAYYLIPSYPLPLLIPLMSVPVVGPAVVDTLDPALRVLVEAGYDRTINPGTPTPANLLYFPNPVKLGTSLGEAIPAGVNLGLQDLAGSREPGTPPEDLTGEGAYGIGGPPVTLPDQTAPDLPAAQVTTTSDPETGTTQSRVPLASDPARTPIPPATRPVPPKILRAPIGASPSTTSIPGIKAVTSALNGVVNKSLTAAAGVLGAKPPSGTGASPGSSPAESSSAGG